MTHRRPPVTVSELLEHEFLAPLGMDAATLAAAIDMPLHQIEQLLQGRRRVDATLDRKLGQVLGTSPGYWLRAQQLHDQDATAFLTYSPASMTSCRWWPYP